MTAPPRGTDEYRWYQEGARDEARARKGGLSRAALGAVEALDALAMAHGDWDERELAEALARIYCPPDPDQPIPCTVADQKLLPRIKIVTKEGITPHLFIIPADMMPLAPGSYDAELVVDG